jgi:hypothetical protein
MFRLLTSMVNLPQIVPERETLWRGNMSEASTPKNWWEAISAHVVWGALVFTCFLVFVEKLLERDYGTALAALLLGLGIAAVALHSKTWLERTNPNWAYAAALALVLALTLSPFIEEKRWPFSAWVRSSGPAVIVHDYSPTTDDIAKAIAPIQAKLDATNHQLQEERERSKSLVPTNSQASREGNYRNEMGLSQSARLTNDLTDFLKRDSPVTIIITGPDDIDAMRFKEDWRILLRTACSREAIRCEFPELPNPKINLDGAIPEAQLAGLTIYQDENSPSLKWGGPDYIAQILRCFIVHTSTNVPRSIERLKGDIASHVLWFQLGRGSPWVSNASQNEQCAPIHG